MITRTIIDGPRQVQIIEDAGRFTIRLYMRHGDLGVADEAWATSLEDAVRLAVIMLGV